MDQAAHGHHGILELLPHLLLFFGIAGILVPLLQRLKVPPILAYLLCGLLLGPYFLVPFTDDFPLLSHIMVKDKDLVTTLGELGIMALMFMIGLELSFSRLIEMRRFVLGLGSAQILVTALVIALIALAFGNAVETAILVGVSLALSSTAIVMQILHEQHRINRPVGRTSFSILLMQDLAVVPLLVILGAFITAGGEGNVLATVIRSLAIAVVVIAGIYLAGRLLLRPLMNAMSHSRNTEWLAALTLFLLAGAAAITGGVGLSAALGAFLAGLLIAETEFRHEIEIILEPLKGLLLGIFFLSVGMMIDLRAVMNNPFWLPMSVAGIFIIKAAVLFPLCLMFGVARRQAAEVAVLLSQAGEFAFLIIGTAMMANLIPPDDGQFFLLTTALSMMLMPLVLKLTPFAVRLAGKGAPSQTEEHKADQEGRVIIAGFGRAGSLLGSILEAQMIPYIAIDNRAERVESLRREGYQVLYGDARRPEFWRRLGADSARAIVITIDQPEAASSILTMIRREWPLTPVIARAHDKNTSDALYDCGATTVVPETLELSLQLAGHVLSHTGASDDDINDITERFRKQSVLRG